MKELFNYARQSRPYADHYGQCLIELENDETIEDVIEQYVKPPKAWYNRHYGNARKLEKYEYEGKVYTGKLVLMDTRDAYTG